MKTLLLLLIAFELKHFFADFPLQTVYMLGKGKKGWAWILPLLSHAGVHALFTVAIVAFYNPALCVQAALIDLVAHFIIDRCKATQNLKQGPWEASEKGQLLSRYYLYLGLDQMFHKLTYIGILAYILN